MYQMGDSKLEVRELLVKAFASAWEAGDKTVDRDTYINSSINVIDSLQVGPEMIYGEEGQGLLEGELDHLPDLLRADGAWVYYEVPAENFFILTWMIDADKAAIARRTKNLEAKGYLVRKASPNDRRSQLLYPTEKAESLKSSKAEIEAEFYEYLTSALPADEAAAFAATLHKLYTASKTESRAGFPHFKQATEGEAEHAE